MSEPQSMTAKFPPGSNAAIDAGCSCPVLDNSHGRGWLCSGNFVISEGCPLHWPSIEEKNQPTEEPTT